MYVPRVFLSHSTLQSLKFSNLYTNTIQDLGAAASISTKAYLTAAASILTVESRHNAYLRAALKASPFPQPFDAPLDFDEVYTLAAAFITSCPANNPPFLQNLPLKAFTALAAAGPSPIKTGSKITLTPAKISWDEKKPLYAAWAAVTGSTFTSAKWVGKGKYEVVVPAGFHGQSCKSYMHRESSASKKLINSSRRCPDHKRHRLFRWQHRRWASHRRDLWVEWYAINTGRRLMKSGNDKSVHT
jgi:hypothetical protein